MLTSAKPQRISAERNVAIAPLVDLQMAHVLIFRVLSWCCAYGVCPPLVSARVSVFWAYSKASTCNVGSALDLPRPLPAIR